MAQSPPPEEEEESVETPHSETPHKARERTIEEDTDGDCVPGIYNIIHHNDICVLQAPGQHTGQLRLRSTLESSSKLLYVDYQLMSVQTHGLIFK